MIEDNPRDVELTLRAFQKRSLANRVKVFEDGVTALDYLFNRPLGVPGVSGPRVILLDLKLPKRSGLEILRDLKADDRTRLIPVVVVTSSREDPDINAAYALGAGSYVVKPVDFANFQEVMIQIGYYWLMVNERQK